MTYTTTFNPDGTLANTMIPAVARSLHSIIEQRAKLYRFQQYLEAELLELMTETGTFQTTTDDGLEVAVVPESQLRGVNREAFDKVMAEITDAELRAKLFECYYTIQIPTSPVVYKPTTEKEIN